jgi:hypothetical protein
MFTYSLEISTKVDEKMMERWFRFSRIVEGRWKDAEKILGYILESTKDYVKMKKRSTSIL